MGCHEVDKWVWREQWFIPKLIIVLLSFRLPLENSSKIGLANKDRKNRPLQQEDEYRIQLELNRYYLGKNSLSVGVPSEQSFYESETTHTPSSRGKQFGKNW